MITDFFLDLLSKFLGLVSEVELMPEPMPGALLGPQKIGTCQPSSTLIGFVDEQGFWMAEGEMPHTLL